MSRPRKNDKHLPPCVFHKHGAYYLVRGGKWERIGTELATALAEYGRRIETPKGSCDKLINEAFAAMKPRLSDNTISQYETVSKMLKKILAEFAPEQVLPKHAAAIKLDGAKTPNMTNRLLSFARQVFDYALEQQLVNINPFVGIKRHKEATRERLISQSEFDAIYAKASPRLQCMMDLWYLTGQRVMDVVKIHRTDIRDEGVYFKQDKTDAKLLVKWSSELRAVVERAKTLNGNVRSMTLFSTRRGKNRGGAPGYSTVRDQWQTACEAAGVQDADLRDLRAMSGTAAEAQGKNPTALLGHTSPSMTKRYLRAKQTPEVEGPSFRRLIDSVK